MAGKSSRIKRPRPPPQHESADRQTKRQSQNCDCLGKPFNLTVLFFEKHLESDAGAFKRGSNNFAVCHDGTAGIGKIKFHSDFLPGKKPVPGVNKDAAGTDVVNGCLETAFHGPAICNHQLAAGDFFAGIFSSFYTLGLIV
jgi:hypothetical protein